MFSMLFKKLNCQQMKLQLFQIKLDSAVSVLLPKVKGLFLKHISPVPALSLSATEKEGKE